KRLRSDAGGLFPRFAECYHRSSSCIQVLADAVGIIAGDPLSKPGPYSSRFRIAAAARAASPRGPFSTGACDTTLSIVASEALGLLLAGTALASTSRAPCPCDNIRGRQFAPCL